MIALSIGEKKVEDILSQMKQNSNEADLFEIRLDYLDNLDLKAIVKAATKIISAKTKPIILTLRSKNEGGYFSNNANIQFEFSMALIKLSPDYLDIELGWASKNYKILRKENTNVKLIGSYHNFKKTLSEYGLRQIARRIAWIKADIIKIVCMANEYSDNISMFQTTEFISKRYKKDSICFCMGEKGTISRAITESQGGLMTFCNGSEENTTATGQITISKLIDIKQKLNLTNKNV